VPAGDCHTLFRNSDILIANSTISRNYRLLRSGVYEVSIAPTQRFVTLLALSSKIGKFNVNDKGKPNID